MPQMIFGASFLLENPVPIVLGGILFSALALFALLFVLIVVPEFTMYLPKVFGFVT